MGFAFNAAKTVIVGFVIRPLLVRHIMFRSCGRLG
jgi:hypothetical protein